jgi:hypothetical protein
MVVQDAREAWFEWEAIWGSCRTMHIRGKVGDRSCDPTNRDEQLNAYRGTIVALRHRKQRSVAALLHPVRLLWTGFSYLQRASQSTASASGAWSFHLSNYY